MKQILYTQCQTELPNIDSSHSYELSCTAGYGKRKRVEGQASLHTADSPTDFSCSTTALSVHKRLEKFSSPNNF